MRALALGIQTYLPAIILRVSLQRFIIIQTKFGCSSCLQFMIPHILVFKQKFQINNDSTVIIKTHYFNSVILHDKMKFLFVLKILDYRDISKLLELILKK